MKASLLSNLDHLGPALLVAEGGYTPSPVDHSPEIISMVASARRQPLRPFAGIDQLAEQAYRLAEKVGRVDLAHRHWITFRLIAPEVGSLLPARRHDPIHHEYRPGDTERRAPFFWTQRCYHGLVDFLFDLAAELSPRRLLLGLTEIDQSGPEMREFIAVLARRTTGRIALWLSVAGRLSADWRELLQSAGRTPATMAPPAPVPPLNPAAAPAHQLLAACSTDELVEHVDWCSFHGAWADAVDAARMALVRMEPADSPLFRRLTEALRVALNGLNQTVASEQLILHELAITTDRKRRVCLLNYLAIGLVQSGGDVERAAYYSQLARTTAEGGATDSERASLGLVATHGMIIVLARQGEPAQGIALGEQAITTLLAHVGPEVEAARQSMILYLMGQSAELLGRYPEAVAYYRRSLAVDPHYPEYYYYLAGALTRGGWFEEALEVCAEGIERTPPYWRLHMWQGRALAGLGRNGEALAQFDRAVDLGHLAPEPLISRALFHHEQGDLPDAEADYTAYLQLVPRDVEALTNRGAVRHDRGDPEGALVDLTAALAIRPDLVAAKANRAAVLVDLGRIEEALQDLEAALAIDERNEILLQNREALLALQGERTPGGGE